MRVESIDELVEFFTAAGKKGVAINRYKGLGEMNPDTLWETTMNPATRTLAQVRAEDHMEADLMFTTLMGDQVEPRRKFIEDNALDVKNLESEDSLSVLGSWFLRSRFDRSRFLPDARNKDSLGAESPR